VLKREIILPPVYGREGNPRVLGSTGRLSENGPCKSAERLNGEFLSLRRDHFIFVKSILVIESS
jgi:hypothetical protein